MDTPNNRSPIRWPSPPRSTIVWKSREVHHPNTIDELHTTLLIPGEMPVSLTLLLGLVSHPRSIVVSSTPAEARIDANVCRNVWKPGITAHSLPASVRLKWPWAMPTVSGFPSLQIVN